MFRVEATNTN